MMYFSHKNLSDKILLSLLFTNTFKTEHSWIKKSVSTNKTQNFYSSTNYDPGLPGVCWEAKVKLRILIFLSILHTVTNVNNANS